MATAVPEIAPTEPHIEREESPDGANEHIAWLTSQVRGTRFDSRQYLLVLRFALVNMVGFALLGAAYIQGYVDMIIAADETRLSVAIAAVFLVGLGLCGWKVALTSRELNEVRNFDALRESAATNYIAKLRGIAGDSRSIIAGVVRLRLSHRIAVVRQIANSLVLLGLIGTVIGFVIALSGIDPQRASEFESISPMVSTLIRGMSTALYTTMVGAVLNLWLMINYHMLATGTVKLVTAMQELGEKHART